MIAAFRSIVTYVAVALYVLLIGPPSVLLAIAHPATRRSLYHVGAFGVRLGLLTERHPRTP